MIVTRSHCRTCLEKRPFEKKGPCHVLHLLLTILSGGFWLPVWFLCCISVSFNRYRCRTCGEARHLFT